MIDLGQIEAGLVVATESSRDLIETTINDLNRNASVTRDDVKLAFASLTIGSGSAAAVLTHRSTSRTGNRLLGGICRAATEHHGQCQGGPDGGFALPATPRMRTDSESMLHAGCALAKDAWESFKDELGWTNETPSNIFCHQVGSAHRRLLLETLGLAPEKDYSTLSWLGNTGSVAAPITAALAIESGRVCRGERFGLLGIGSGLNSIMLGVEWVTSVAATSNGHGGCGETTRSIDAIGQPPAASLT
jgi:3-oxoacyl-[acyl-carrier-protein] synthase-3